MKKGTWSIDSIEMYEVKLKKIQQILMTNLNMSKTFFGIMSNSRTSYWIDWISLVKWYM